MLDEAAGEWVINGEKAFITNSGTEITAFVTVTARTGPGEISTIIVPSGTPGFEVQPAVPEDGLARVRHPRAHLHRRPRAGGQPARRAGPRVRPVPRRSSTRAASPSPRWRSGCVQACLEHCTRYAQDRHAFGRPIGANQGVAFQVADLAVMAETARLLTYQAAWLHDTGRP